MRFTVLLMFMALTGCDDGELAKANKKANNEFCWARGFDFYYAENCAFRGNDSKSIEHIKFMEENQ